MSLCNVDNGRERARVAMRGPVRKILTLHRQEEGLWKGEREMYGD